VVVCEIPLLFESGLEEAFDLVVTIEAPADARRERWSTREQPQVMEELNRLQMDSAERLQRSDMGFLNDGGLDGLRAFVAAAFERASALLDPRPSPCRAAGGPLP
jgi:dephospho-CoA kinase